MQQTLTILTVIAIVIGLGVAARKRSSAALPDGMPGGPRRQVSLWLTVVAVALFLVGIVSATPLRHLIQIAPLLVALAWLALGSRLAVSAASPLFAFWLLLMCVIWLFLLGVAQLVSGRFTAVEIVLTIVVGAASALGLHAVWRAGDGHRWSARLATVIAFAVLQLAALMISVLPSIARH